MELKKLPDTFSVCKVEGLLAVWMNTQHFALQAQRNEEHSLVCPTDSVPANTTERGRRMESVSDSGRTGFLAHRNPGGHFPDPGRKQNRNLCHIDF